MYSRELFFRKHSNYVIFWIITVAILLIAFLFIAFYKYTPYYKTAGIYDKEGKYVSFILENNKLFYIHDTEINIDNQKLDSTSIVVGDVIYAENKIYQNLKVFIPNEFQEGIVNVSFKLPKTTILNTIWKGLIE